MNIHNHVLLICIDSLNICSVVYTFKFSNRDTDWSVNKILIARHIYR